MPWRRASQPSRKSVTQARRKQTAATARAAGVGSSSTPTSTGTRPIRSSVRRFGSAARNVPRATASATGLEANAVLPQVRDPIAQHPREILACLGDGRDAARLLDPPSAGVVGGDRERQVAPVAIEQHAQVAAAALDVV